MTPRAPAISQSNQRVTIMGDEPHPSRATIAASPTVVWGAAKAVYADMGVPVTIENPSAHQIGNNSFYKTRTFAGEPMAQLVDCGTGMDGPKAASYRIYMSLLTIIQPDGKGGTDVQTTFVPIGQDMSGGASDRIPCGTTGHLEEYFLSHLQSAVGKS
ncbi:MAG TPA: hypothetical protein VHV78_10825 [Gemmatimonadaceae bacterium]|nr:hypothetical protein [Gemmatimonadaceae bacterium]